MSNWYRVPPMNRTAGSGSEYSWGKILNQIEGKNPAKDVDLEIRDKGGYRIRFVSPLDNRKDFLELEVNTTTEGGSIEKSPTSPGSRRTRRKIRQKERRDLEKSNTESEKNNIKKEILKEKDYLSKRKFPEGVNPEEFDSKDKVFYDSKRKRINELEESLESLEIMDDVVKYQKEISEVAEGYREDKGESFGSSLTVQSAAWRVYRWVARKKKLGDVPDLVELPHSKKERKEKEKEKANPQLTRKEPYIKIPSNPKDFRLENEWKLVGSGTLRPSDVKGIWNSWKGYAEKRITQRDPRVKDDFVREEMSRMKEEIRTKTKELAEIAVNPKLTIEEKKEEKRKKKEEIDKILVRLKNFKHPSKSYPGSDIKPSKDAPRRRPLSSWLSSEAAGPGYLDQEAWNKAYYKSSTFKGFEYAWDRLADKEDQILVLKELKLDKKIQKEFKSKWIGAKEMYGFIWNLLRNKGSDGMKHFRGLANGSHGDAVGRYMEETLDSYLYHLSNQQKVTRKHKAKPPVDLYRYKKKFMPGVGEGNEIDDELLERFVPPTGSSTEKYQKYLSLKPEYEKMLDEIEREYDNNISNIKKFEKILKGKNSDEELDKATESLDKAKESSKELKRQFSEAKKSLKFVMREMKMLEKRLNMASPWIREEPLGWFREAAQDDSSLSKWLAETPTRAGIYSIQVGMPESLRHGMLYIEWGSGWKPGHGFAGFKNFGSSEPKPEDDHRAYLTIGFTHSEDHGVTPSSSLLADGSPANFFGEFHWKEGEVDVKQEEKNRKEEEKNKKLREKEERQKLREKKREEKKNKIPASKPGGKKVNINLDMPSDSDESGDTADARKKPMELNMPGDAPLKEKSRTITPAEANQIVERYKSQINGAIK